MHSGFIYVSSQVAQLLSQYDLGNGALYPVELFENDKKTKIDQAYYALNIGNQKHTIALEHSPSIKADINFPGEYDLPFDLAAVSGKSLFALPAALSGPESGRIQGYNSHSF